MRPDARLPEVIWGGHQTVAGVTYKELASPGPERDKAAALVLKQLKATAANLEDSVDALRALVAQHEPVEFISAIAIPTSMDLGAPGRRVDDAAETVTWPAKIEYLLGLALSLPRGEGSSPNQVTEAAVGLLGDVFDAAHARQTVQSVSAVSQNPNMDLTLFMLRTEHLMDRMPGYAVHLEMIDAEVFDRHRGFYIEAIGFNPADVTRVVRRHIRASGARVNTALADARRFINTKKHRAGRAVADMLEEITALRNWQADRVAADTGLNATEVQAMLSFFSTCFGSQPDFLYPTDVNLARVRPCVDLGDGSYFVADPWSLPAAVHPRLAQLALEAPGGPVSRYHRHRQDGHQRIVAGAFRSVFGESLVSERCHYVSAQEGPGELDVLVPTEWPLAVEAKAHGLTDSGRRGAPRRVERVAGDVVKVGLEQTRRAHTYILDEHGRTFGASAAGPFTVLLPADLTGITEIIVTFERMDPLATMGPDLVDQAGREVWIVCLADLLMVTEILADAAAFHHYARTRAAMSVRGPVVYMESDALGGYLDDRLDGPIAMAAKNPATTLILGYTSGSINHFYTAREAGHSTDPPLTGVPHDVAMSLGQTAATTTGAWPRIVDDVMAATPDKWRQWRSFARRHRHGAVFALSEQVGLVTGATGAQIEPGERLLHHIRPTGTRTGASRR